MSVERATANPAVVPGQGGGDQVRRNDPYRFLSTRLVRELIAADSQAEVADEGRRALAQRLVEVVGMGLSQPGVALLDAASLGVIASRGFEAEEQGILSGPGSAESSLPRRALEQRRVFLLGRGSREALLPALREVRGEWSGVVVVPLCDREQSAGVLVLGATETTLPAAFLRSLAPAFRLLTLLLHPGRHVDLASGELTPPGDAELLAVEVEDLRARLAETRETCRTLQDEDSSSQAAQRAESESFRARIAELEAALATGGTRERRVEELEAELKANADQLSAREERLVSLESEKRQLIERAEAAETARLDAEARARASSTHEGSLGEGLRPTENVGVGREEEETTALPLLDEDDLELGEIAEAAAAAIEDDSDSSAGEVEVFVESDLEAPVEPEAPSAVFDEVPVPPDDVSGEPGPALGLWHLDSHPDARAFAEELAARCGAVLWTGDGDPPPAGRNMLVMNLFDEAAGRAFELVDRDVDSLVYASDAESGQGFEIGPVGWVRRPLDPADALERIQSRVPRRLGGIVIVSAQLRELAGLRQALAEVDAAGSVACDTRQASDLLEIVRRPDAVLIDLALEAGQGFALARQLRSQPETADIPILFLLPETVQPETLRADAERGGVIGRYGTEDARRLLNGALAERS